MDILIKTDGKLKKRLEEIRDLTARDSVTNVVRDAIELYDLIVDAVSKDQDIHIGGAQLLLSQLEKARPKDPAPRTPRPPLRIV